MMLPLRIELAMTLKVFSRMAGLRPIRAGLPMAAEGGFGPQHTDLSSICYPFPVPSLRGEADKDMDKARVFGHEAGDRRASAWMRPPSSQKSSYFNGIY